jgi:hypothetical protein
LELLLAPRSGLVQRLNNWRVGWCCFCVFFFCKNDDNRNTSS